MWGCLTSQEANAFYVLRELYVSGGHIQIGLWEMETW